MQEGISLSGKISLESGPERRYNEGTRGKIFQHVKRSMARILSTLAAESEPRRSDIIRSVVRALSILELLARFPRGLTAKEVSARVHLHLSTTYHLLNTLVETGYIVKDPDSQLFRISGKIGYTTYGTASPAQIVRHLSPHVRSLQEDTQETAYLSLWDGNNIVLSAIVESPLSVRVKVLTVGYSEGNHAMALGKAILAHLREQDLDAYLTLHGMEAYTDNTCTDRRTFKRILSDVRRRGYSLDIEEFLPDVCCIGAPIFDAEKHIAASIAISLPRSRYENRHTFLVPKVMRAAAAASRTLRILGYQATRLSW